METMQIVFHKRTVVKRYKFLSDSEVYHVSISGYFKRMPEMSWLLY